MPYDSKPKPSMLGSGMAERAGKALKCRRTRIDLYVDQATSGKKRKKESEKD